ncbi:phosphatidic acid phosphatase type 2 domain-containing protein 1A, putative [Entamoeba dispar SAW760]|uniref:Phosphatidic acid phosphatase type 2 domain-containing protein 1A, putative n=1 Tax=Entamoeba dispar (strain ATCC PRA-260 / SAW760) TaxID=370354 RepID=B0EK76_ENTDS|nr:phosphatidic acid phosphatase type 2 domain-containing protein 1A, putative [Entamoeba dispar SAW760]EDR25069.1 phosphatidic acid phosphatase type 2 domain-containing protein 1A, putative [Entamoeba dispar SAW760]|eukprot:EDR25069.1 phosphatidic acid phosphatase type 2 domain-containing protein 1A, putative [Entamoeba dispar SAW760]
MSIWTKIKHSFSLLVISEIFSDVIVFGVSLLTIIITLFCSPNQMVIPNERSNVNVDYPYIEKETIPFWLCALISYVPPFLLILLFSFFKKSSKFLCYSLFCLILCISSNIAVTNCAKLFAGRPRPHFYSRLSEHPEQVKSVYQSFPSGHSSSISNGMTFCTLLLAGQMKIFASSQESWKLLVVSLPSIVAIFIMITRTRDYYHNFSDIIGGGIIGFFTTLLFYCSKFNSLSSEHSDDLKITSMTEVENQTYMFDV